MKYRTMRFIGGEENVSLLGLGCMRFPLNEDGTIDEAQAEAMIGRALNAGINYIDTAYPYHKGESEPFLGRALKKYPRNSFYLATKLPVWLVNSVEDAERLFNRETNVLLLDEPTNHLDVDAKEELARALKAYKGSVLLICHEPEFYEGFATRVVDCSEFCLRG